MPAVPDGNLQQWKRLMNGKGVQKSTLLVSCKLLGLI